MQYDASLILLFGARHVCVFCRDLSHTYESGAPSHDLNGRPSRYKGDALTN